MRITLYVVRYDFNYYKHADNSLFVYRIWKLMKISLFILWKDDWLWKGGKNLFYEQIFF